MRKPDESDKIVLALVIVLGVIVVGVFVLQMTKTLTGDWIDLGSNVGTFFATIGGGIVGIAGAYVTNSPWKEAGRPEEVEMVPITPVPLDDLFDDDEPEVIEEADEPHSVREDEPHSVREPDGLPTEPVEPGEDGEPDADLWDDDEGEDAGPASGWTPEGDSPPEPFEPEVIPEGEK